MTELQKFAKKHKPIFWDISESAIERLSEEAIVERFLNYGTWEDYKTLEKTLGIQKEKKIFEFLAKRPRSNLRPETVDFFTDYFRSHA